MAADVLAYRAHEVPVGEDQREHIELMRDVAEALQQALRRDARRPRGQHPDGRRADRATSRSPTKKMSTTGGTRAGTVYVDEEPASIVKKFKRAETDSGARDRARRRQARHLEPDRDPRRRARRRAGGDRARLRGQGLRRLQDRRRRGGRRLAGPVRERYLELREDTARDRGDLRGRRRRRRARSRRVAGRRARGDGRRRPSEAPPSLPAVRIAQLELDLDVFAGSLRPAAVADPARGARPARGRPRRGRHRLPRPPGVARASSTSRPRPSSWC